VDRTIEPIMTITQLYILVALRKAELTKGPGFAAKLEGGDVAAGKVLAARRPTIVTLGRAIAPNSGTTIALTEAGRTLVDDLAGRVQ
jgi:hypothetical protein